MDDRLIQLLTHLMFTEYALITLPESAPEHVWLTMLRDSVTVQGMLEQELTPAARMYFYSLCP